MPKPRFLLKAHRWIAFAFAPLLALQAVTGGVLLFRDELAPLAMPAQSSAASDLPLSALVRSAGRTYPDMRLTRLFFPPDRRSAAFAHFQASGGAMRYATIAPDNGAILSQGSILRFPLEAALQLHYQLLSGTGGMAVVALNGLALALLATTGLWQWWPAGGRLASALRIPARIPARLRLRSWHRSVGALLALVLATSSATGFLLAAPGLFSSSGTGATASNAALPDDRSIDRAYALAQRAFPKSRPRDIRFSPDGSMAVNFYAPRGGRWGVDLVTVSTAENRVTERWPLERNDALWLTSLPIHTGDVIGPAGRWPMLAAALALTFLALSGPIAWWRSRRKGKAE